MSLVLNMVGGAGGAGLKDTDAVLVVTVPTGSTVTATKGGVTLTPTMWVTAADSTLDCAIFSIKASLFDAVSPWTVTATHGTVTRTAQVIISENKEYEMLFYLHVPDGYTEVEYIQNTGSSWIDMGISPAIDFSADFTACSDATGDGLFGIYATNGGSGYRVGVYVTGGKYVLYSRNGTGTTEYPINHAATLGELVEFHYEQAANSQILQAFGLTASNNAATVQQDKCSFFRYYGTQVYYCKGKLKKAILYNDGVKSRETYACYRDSDSAAGMWDSVSQTFLGNAGSGSFVVGADIKEGVVQ